MNDSSLKLTLREMQVFLGSPKTIVGVLTVGLLLGMVGPFQTFEHLSLVPRLAYWTLISVLTFCAGSFGATLVSHMLTRRNFNKGIAIVLSWTAAGCLVSAIVMLVNIIAFDVALAELPELLLYCFIIALGVLMLVNFYETSDNEAKTNAPPPILKRINVTLRGPLVSLSVSDHYVEVATIKGKELVLMRLSDAIAETQGAAGLQIHRSHWVVIDQIASVSKKNSKTLVSLHNGAVFPISRTFLADAKAAGIF